MSSSDEDEPYDVVVVGAGIGGIYAVYRFREMGLRVLGLEGADGVGGVWYHNGYPGARVDIDSVDYSYYFDEALYREWKWSERFATQPELLRYLNHVVDRFDLRKDFVFGTWVEGAQWLPEQHQYVLSTSTGTTVRTQFLVMATGNLSKPRDLEFAGLEDFEGEWVRTSHWPQEGVSLAGRRVAVIGTGSSGIQTISAIADEVDELFVFQRSPNYSVPAVNGPVDEEQWSAICRDVPAERERLWGAFTATHARKGHRTVGDCTPEEREKIMQGQWDTGGHDFSIMFNDQAKDAAANEVVAEFVRRKIREIVKDPEVAEALCPYDHPVGVRRLCLDTGYYETFNRPHVHLVNVKQEPIERLTRTGIKTTANEYDVDVAIFATGFEAFTGALAAAGIKNEHGELITGRWNNGPRTYMGLMTDGFPNLFFLTGPGSPSVLANLTLNNEFHVEWVAELIADMLQRGSAVVEPTPSAVEEWTAHVAEIADRSLVTKVSNYMLFTGEDGSRTYMPYIGGFGNYAKKMRTLAETGYPGLELSS